MEKHGKSYDESSNFMLPALGVRDRTKDRLMSQSMSRELGKNLKEWKYLIRKEVSRYQNEV